MRIRAIRGLLVAAGLIFVAAACGDSDNNTRSDAGTPSTMATGHHHEGVTDVDPSLPTPLVAIDVSEDPKSGWNLRIDIENFRLAPENVSTDHVVGEGHMHLYIDGEKITRLYEPWHHLGALEPGDHEIRVELSANDHSALASEGALLDDTVTIDVPEPDGDHELAHAQDDTVEAAEPRPSVTVVAHVDPEGGWNIRATPTNFRLAPENVSTDHVAGEGHMHLYIDGEKITRLYGEWFRIPALPAGEHEVRVELSANDHSTVVVEGAPVDASVTVSISEGDGSNAQPQQDDGHGHDHADGGSTRFEADVEAAVQTIEIAVEEGAPVGGRRTVEVEVGTVVALLVTSDVADTVHVHGYDILEPVSPDASTQFAFVAEIPGVFEVELETAGRLLIELEIS